MEEKCGENLSGAESFFKGYERIIILIYIFVSFIINIIIISSIFIVKQRSLILRVTESILIVNFINILSYSFQWVLCNDNKKENDYYYIKLLTGNSNDLVMCKLQSFLIFFSSVSQDYLIILFVYIVNKKTLIKSIFVNLLIIIAIFVPFCIAFLFTQVDALGVNDDFCYIKKYKKAIFNNTQIGFNNSQIYDDYYYQINPKFSIFSIIIYGIRTINFIITILFLIKIIKYIKREDSKIHFLNKLYIFFIQLFKLFIIVSYRLLNLIFVNYPKHLRNIFIILSSIDGILIPLVYSYSNDIFQTFCYTISKGRFGNKKEFEEEKVPSSTLFQNNNIDEDKIKKIINSPESNAIIPGLSYKVNNFDLSY